MLSARDPIRRRQPVERPLDIVGLELLVSVTQALLVGTLLSIATQLGGDARAYGLPIPGLLALLGIVVGIGWLRWLMGGSGWLMASVCLATSILAGALWLLALQDASQPRVDPLVGLIAVACALYGLAAGVFLDGPHHAHWKGGVSQPHRGVPQTRATPARFSPPVQKVVDERLGELHMPHLSLPKAPKVGVPSVRRIGRADASPATPSVGDGLAIAADVVPQSPTTAEPVVSVEPPPDASAAGAPASATPRSEVAEPTDRDATETAKPSADAPTEAVASRESGPVPDEVAQPRDPDPPDGTAGEGSKPEAASTTDGASAITTTMPEAAITTDGASAEADPEAPTEPVARPAPQWPRPIEPRGHTGAHKGDAEA